MIHLGSTHLDVSDISQICPTEESAERFFENVRWKDSGRFCPHCGSLRTVARTKRTPLPYRCKDCRKDFSIRNGSIMFRSHVPLRKWLMAVFILSQSKEQPSVQQLAHRLDMRQSSTNRLIKKIIMASK